MDLVDKAIKEGRSTLSEFESKRLLAAYGIPVAREILVADISEVGRAAAEIGYPLVLKGCAPDLSHKTERNLVRVDIRTESEASQAFREIVEQMDVPQGAVLVQEMVSGRRELMVGLTRDPQFGPCVMFGLGGIFTEVLKDVSFRVAPIERKDAHDMMTDIRGHRILEGIRGMEPVNRELLADILVNVGRIGLEVGAVKEIDINPLIIRKGAAVAVDALVVLSRPAS